MRIAFRKLADKTPTNVTIPDHIVDHFRAVHADLRAFLAPEVSEGLWAETIEKTLSQVVRDADQYKTQFPEECEGRSLVTLIEEELLERSRNATLVAVEQSNPGQFVRVDCTDAWNDTPIMVVEAVVRFSVAGQQGSAPVQFFRSKVSDPWEYDAATYDDAHEILERFGYGDDGARINKCFSLTSYYNKQKS